MTTIADLSPLLPHVTEQAHGPEPRKKDHDHISTIMISLGIDPGSRRIGYGVVEKKKDNALRFIAAGILKIKSTSDIAALAETKKGAVALMKKYKPDIMGIEKLYFAKNQKTAMAVSQARGVLLLAAHDSGIPIREYAPNEIKLGVAGYGFADKKAVLKMVRLILGEHHLEIIDDASDALAGAIMAANERV
jgi:crossover junction endodeoxyribonuclease RuvC